MGSWIRSLTGIDSPFRRLGKRLLHVLLGDTGYSYVQALVTARDIRTGRYQEPELELLPLALRPGETAIDVGANFGLYVYHLSRIVGPGGRVFAFEPVEYTASTLRKIVRLLRLRNVRVIAKGCGERAASASFVVPIQKTGAVNAGVAHLARRDEHHGRASRRSRTERVELVPVDEELDGARDVSFLKLDTEGSELMALRGARGILSRDRPTVLCEVEPAFMAGYGLEVRELVSFFIDLGYEAYSFDGGRLRRVSTLEQGNYLFVPPERRSRLLRLIERD